MEWLVLTPQNWGSGRVTIAVTTYTHNNLPFLMV